MFRLILICLMAVTIIMPRHFYKWYMQALAALGLLFIVLTIIAYENQPGDAASNDIYVMVGFVSMNAVIVVAKYMLLRRAKAKPSA